MNRSDLANVGVDIGSNTQVRAGRRRRAPLRAGRERSPGRRRRQPGRGPRDPPSAAETDPRGRVPRVGWLRPRHRGPDGRGQVGMDASFAKPERSDRRSSQRARCPRVNTGGQGCPIRSGYGTKHFGVRDQTLWGSGPSTLGSGTDRFGERNRPLPLGYGAGHFGLRPYGLWGPVLPPLGFGGMGFGERRHGLWGSVPPPLGFGTSGGAFGIAIFAGVSW